VSDALALLSEKWTLDPRVIDLHLGKRDDVVDTPVVVDGVVFHIPTLSREQLYVLWNCLWPECHNCCDRQGRLPLTKDDIKIISAKMGYDLQSKFLKNETKISAWQEQESLGNIITNLTMISLKRKVDETDEQDGKPLKCRFLDSKGSCSIHPSKPGVCWLYPFASWLESSPTGRPIVHATFQFTGDCPGFFISDSLDSSMPMLRDYSRRIYDYNMAVSRTGRENYGAIHIIDLNS
jgi:uncharacterized protein